MTKLLAAVSAVGLLNLGTAGLTGAAQQGAQIQQTVIVLPQPARPMATIGFLGESGVDRWQVRLNGKVVHLRVAGSGCTNADEVYAGYATFLMDNMSFSTRGGRVCRIVAIER